MALRKTIKREYKEFDTDLSGFTRIRLRSFFFFGLHPKNKKHFPIVPEAQNENLFSPA